MSSHGGRQKGKKGDMRERERESMREEEKGHVREREHKKKRKNARAKLDFLTIYSMT